MAEYINRGYLVDDYRLFHIRDRVSLHEIEYHYHEFHKVLMFISGSASYVIEGKHYLLAPLDIVLVPRGCVHKPEVGLSAPYERYVLYLSPAFLRKITDCDLELCFKQAESSHSHVLRPASSKQEQLNRLLTEIEGSVSGSEFGSGCLARLLIYELMIELGRSSQSPSPVVSLYDEKTVMILDLINNNLTGDISIDSLAETFYISKYHMMHRFKAETGYSIHSYITNKRLLLARDLLLNGAGATEACYSCGYKDYSAFSSAYKKQFGVSPKKKA